MKWLAVVLCLAAIVSSGQADSYKCGRIGRCPTPGRTWRGASVCQVTTPMWCANDMFGLRTVEAGGQRSLAKGAYSSARDSSSRAAIPRVRAYAAEAGGALVGCVLIGAGAGLAGGAAGLAIWGHGNDFWFLSISFFLGATCGIALGYPAGCAMGAATVGRWKECDGNTGGAYAGAYIGLLLPFIGSPIGAVIGYNTGGSPLGARLDPPTLAYRTRLGPDRQRYSAFDCRLVTVRF